MHDHFVTTQQLHANMQCLLGIVRDNFAYSECMAFGNDAIVDANTQSSLGIFEDNLAYSECMVGPLANLCCAGCSWQVGASQRPPAGGSGKWSGKLALYVLSMF